MRVIAALLTLVHTPAAVVTSEPTAANPAKLFPVPSETWSSAVAVTLVDWLFKQVSHATVIVPSQLAEVYSQYLAATPSVKVELLTEVVVVTPS